MKPANILVGIDETDGAPQIESVKLADFGIAKAAGESTSLTSTGMTIDAVHLAALTGLTAGERRHTENALVPFIPMWLIFGLGRRPSRPSGETGQRGSTAPRTIFQVGVDGSNGFSGWIADRFAESNVVQRNSILTRSLQNAAALAAAGFGVAAVPRSALSPAQGWAMLEPRLRRPVLSVTRSSPRGAVADLVDAIRQRVTEVTFGWAAS